MKLRNRLMAVLTLVTATVLGISFISVYLFVQRDELAALDQSLLIQAHNAPKREPWRRRWTTPSNS